jgi:hypothetical protein
LVNKPYTFVQKPVLQAGVLSKSSVQRAESATKVSVPYQKVFKTLAIF